MSNTRSLRGGSFERLVNIILRKCQEVEIKKKHNELDLAVNKHNLEKVPSYTHFLCKKYYQKSP